MVNLESIMIITAATGSAVLVVIIIVWIGCVYNDRTRYKVDVESKKMNNIDKLEKKFPEKLDTLETYFDQHESAESSMFVTKVSTQETNLQEENKQKHKNVHDNQDNPEATEEKETRHEKHEGAPEVEMTSDNEMKTGVHATSKVERGNNSEVKMIESNKRTEQTDILTGNHNYNERIIPDKNGIVSASDENGNSDTTSGEIYELMNTNPNETGIMSMETAHVDAIKADADSRRECASQDEERGSKLRFLESILITNSAEDLHEQEQMTESKNRRKKRSKGMLLTLKHFQIGLFHYYYHQENSPLKKWKKNPRASPSMTNEQTRRTPSPSNRHCVSYPRPYSKSDQNIAEQQTKEQCSVMVEPKSRKKSKNTSLISGTNKTNTQTESGGLRKKTSTKYNSSASCFTLSLP